MLPSGRGKRGSRSSRGSRPPPGPFSAYRGGRGGWRQPQVVEPTTPPPPLGEMIEQLNASDLVDDKTPSSAGKSNAKITDKVLVASFNWRDGKTPTIVVPGRPPRWTPLPEPREIPDDNGNMGSRDSPSTREAFRDENSGRFPRHPMEPAIVAALEMDPLLPSGHSRPDIVACGSTLGSLLRFVSGSDRPFRMLVEAVGDTVFLVRRENSPTELIPNIQGFGHSFPEHYTTWDQDVKGSLSHQRLMRYRFGGLQLLVRFEGDGYMAQTSSSGGSQSAKKEKLSKKTSPSSVDDLLGSLERTGVSLARTSTDTELQVQRAGELIDQSLVFDLKTRSIKKVDQDILGEEMPRLWVRQMSNFIVAYHERGVFKKIDVIPVEDKIKRWEAENSDKLTKLATLVHRIRSLAIKRQRGGGDGKFEVCYSGGALEFRKQLPDASDALSKKVKDAWGANHETSSLDSSDDFEDEEDDYNNHYTPAADWRGPLGLGAFGNDEKGEDYTACSDECGYCGHCTY